MKTILTALVATLMINAVPQAQASSLFGKFSYSKSDSDRNGNDDSRGREGRQSDDGAGDHDSGKGDHDGHGEGHDGGKGDHDGGRGGERD